MAFSGSSIGLGITISVVNKASAALQKIAGDMLGFATSSERMEQAIMANRGALGGMALAGAAFGVAGYGIKQVGDSIIDTFTGVTKTLIESGQYMEQTHVLMDRLYGNKELANKRIDELKVWATKSPFQFKQLLGMNNAFQTAGIDIMQKVSTTFKDGTQSTQALGQYLSDFAAFSGRPMEELVSQSSRWLMSGMLRKNNAFGAMMGAQMAKMGISNKQLTTTQERIDFFVKAMAQMGKGNKGIVGATEDFAKTTKGRISNLADFLDVSKWQAAEPIMETFRNVLESIIGFLDSMINGERSEKYKKMFEAFGTGINNVLKVVGKVVLGILGIVKAVGDFLAEHPKLVEWLTTFVAFSGVILSVIGSLMMLLGTFMLLRAGWLIFIKSLDGILSFKNTIATIGTALKMGFWTFMKSAGLLAIKFVAIGAIIAAVAYLIYKAWDRNFLGIRTGVTKLFKTIGDLFSLVGSFINYFADAFDGDNMISDQNYQLEQQYSWLKKVVRIVKDIGKAWDDATFSIERFLMKHGLIDSKNTFAGNEDEIALAEQKKWERIKKGFEPVDTKIDWAEWRKDLWGKLTETDPKTEREQAVYDNQLSVLQDRMKASWGNVQDEFSMGGNIGYSPVATEGYVNDFSEKWGAAWETVKGYANDFGEWLTGYLDNKWQWITVTLPQYFSDVWEQVKGTASSAVDWIAQKFNELSSLNIIPTFSWPEPPSWVRWLIAKGNSIIGGGQMYSNDGEDMGDVGHEATGGRAEGMTVVGELGPELVDFTSPARVYTKDQTQGLLGGNDGITFESGAINITVASATQEDIDKMADRLISAIDRKRSLRAMAVR